MRRDLLVTASLALLLGITLGQLGFFDAGRIYKGAVNLALFTRETVPPDTGVLAQAGRALLETVQMAFAGTLLGFVIALPMTILGTRFLFPLPVSAFARFIAAFVRTIPALLWALLFVIIVGLGPLAGTLGIAFYTVGYLAKLYAEQLEGTDPEVMEAVRGVGASVPQLVRFVILPEGANNVVSQLLFMFEYNIRASSILGLVGAGGIGFYMLVYVQTLEYQRLATFLLVILGLVLVMDIASGWVRRRFLLSPR